MCTTGVTAAVENLPGGDPAFEAQWGAAIGLDLNAAPPPSKVRSPWDAAKHGVVGFAFDVAFNTPGEIRVRYTNPGVDEPHFATLNTSGSKVIYWEDVAQGPWVRPPNRVTFSPQQVLSIQFVVPSSDVAPVPFDFCISNLRALH